jgi:predicted nucleic acid-binding protein
MASQILIDSGPLIAFFSSSEKYHRWVLGQMSDMNGDLITSESVLSEVVFLLKTHPKALNAISSLVGQGILRIDQAFSESPTECIELVHKYSDLPSSVADVSLVYLHSKLKNSVIFTLDSDFLVYKDKSGKPLRLVAPFV